MVTGGERKMYERMTDKNHMPEMSGIEKFIGNESSTRLQALEETITK